MSGTRGRRASIGVGVPAPLASADVPGLDRRHLGAEGNPIVFNDNAQFCCPALAELERLLQRMVPVEVRTG